MQWINKEEITQQLMEACRSGNKKTVVRLLEEGADVNAKNADGWTALHLALPAKWAYRKLFNSLYL